MKHKWALVIHGGAGVSLKDAKAGKMLSTLHGAAVDASTLLRGRGTAVDAVERAVYILEESGLFNAGRGGCLTSDGRVELDAGICRGSDLLSGAVARVTDYAHPITAARFVMERTNMVAMHGDAVLDLLESRRKVDREILVTAAKLSRLEKGMADIGRRGSFSRRHHPKDLAILLKGPRAKESGRIGTVGAVAVDATGETAAADSTGGYWLKLAGRIGDSPIFGAGFYANRDGAATATGVGEYAVRTLISHAVVAGMRTASAGTAVTLALRELERRFGTDNAGIIAVDRRYGVGIRHNTEGMSHAVMTSDRERPLVRMAVNRPRRH